MLIGLSAYAQSGKDTVGDFLVTQHRFNRKAFADPLRAAALALDPIVDVTRRGVVRLSYLVDNYGWEEAKRCEEVRALLQRLGTEAGRKILGEDIWVDAAMKVLVGNVCFTDVRFPNEADAIRKRQGQVWRIRRPGYGPINDHPSETALDDYPGFTAFIDNDGTIEDLESKVARLLKEVRNGP